MRTLDLLRDHAEDHDVDLPAARRSLQEYGDRLDQETNGTWVAEAISAAVAELHSPPQLLIVDSVRRLSQIEALRDAFPRVDHIHLFAPSRCSTSGIGHAVRAADWPSLAATPRWPRTRPKAR